MPLQLSNLDALISQHQTPPGSQEQDSSKHVDLIDQRKPGIAFTQDQKQLLEESARLLNRYPDFDSHERSKGYRSGLILELTIRTSESWPRNTALETSRASGPSQSGF